MSVYITHLALTHTQVAPQMFALQSTLNYRPENYTLASSLHSLLWSGLTWLSESPHTLRPKYLFLLMPHYSQLFTVLPQLMP